MVKKLLTQNHMYNLKTFYMPLVFIFTKAKQFRELFPFFFGEKFKLTIIVLTQDCYVK